MGNTINVNYMTRAYNQYQQKSVTKDQEKEDTRFADSVREKSESSLPNKTVTTSQAVASYEANFAMAEGK